MTFLVQKGQEIQKEITKLLWSTTSFSRQSKCIFAVPCYWIVTTRALIRGKSADEEVFVTLSVISVLLQLRWLSQSSASLATSNRFAWCVRRTREMFIFILRFIVRNALIYNLGKTQLLWPRWSLSAPLWTMPLTSVEPNVICDYFIKRKTHKVSPLLHIQN